MNRETQFFNTSNRLIRDMTAGLGRRIEDPEWVGAFCIPAIGSFGHECGGFTKMEEGKPTVLGSLGGISFPQWTGMGPKGRRKAFMALCRRLHLHPYSYDAAIAMILYELMGSGKGIIATTMRVPALTVERAVEYIGEDGHTCDRRLLARVVAFEKLYENAGVKHYLSRYNYAVKAKEAFVIWAKAGMPEPGKFVMPNARFSVQFDDEFGRGESETTTRQDNAVAAFVGVGSARPSSRGYAEDALSSAEIKAIQTRLRDLGYVRVGAVDGKWGTNTRASIAALQADNGIMVDGHYGPATRNALANGRPHQVAPERAQATAKVLLAAGEPTIAAVQPVSVGSKALAVVSAAGTAVGGIATLWPQASTMLDSVKASFNDVPGFVWPLLTLCVAAYFYVTSRQVKAVAVDNFRSGANTALATPLVHDDDPGVVLPPVPEPGDTEGDPEALRAERVATVAPERDSEIITSEPDRPLGMLDAEHHEAGL